MGGMYSLAFTIIDPDFGGVCIGGVKHLFMPGSWHLSIDFYQNIQVFELLEHVDTGISVLDHGAI